MTVLVVEGITGQKLDYVVDFTSQLPNGVTLTGTPTSTAIMQMGNDVAANCLNGTPTINGGSKGLSVPLLASVDWANYLITVMCPTTDTKLTMAAVIQLQSRSLPTS